MSYRLGVDVGGVKVWTKGEYSGELVKLVIAQSRAPGGAPGARARKVLRRIDGTSEIVGNKREDLKINADDERDFITWGGGLGDPLNRDPALVAGEIGQGLVRPAGARAYDLVIADGVLDQTATEALRGKMRAERGTVIPLVNCGASIDAQRALSQARTGLAAPIQPEWSHPAISA